MRSLRACCTRVSFASSLPSDINGPATLLALPTDEASSETVLKRLRAELDLLREELDEQLDLNSSLLSQNDELRRENDELKTTTGDDDDVLPAELAALQLPREAFASATLEHAVAASPAPDELNFVPPPPPPRGDDAAAAEDPVAAAEQDAAAAEDVDANALLEAALGVAAIIVLFCVLRKISPEKSQRAAKVCSAVLSGAWAFLKNPRRSK